MSSPSTWIVDETMIQKAIDQRPNTNPLDAIGVGGELVVPRRA